MQQNGPHETEISYATRNEIETSKETRILLSDNLPPTCSTAAHIYYQPTQECQLRQQGCEFIGEKSAEFVNYSVSGYCCK